jgi:cytochrome c oxidase cbb3-type subunit 2
VPYSSNQEEYQRNVKHFGEKVAKTLVIADAQKNLVDQAQEGNYDGDRSSVSEMDALIAYLQMLGTMVDFSKIKPEDLVKYR